MTDWPRRRLLGSLSAAAGAALLGSFAGGARAAGLSDEPGWVPGLQLYTLGDAPAKDLAGTLETVSRIGYRAIELPGFYGRSPAELRRALDRAQLICPAIHAAPRKTPGMWDIEGEIEKLAADVRLLGAEYVVVPIMLLPDAVMQGLRNPPPGGFTQPAVLDLLAKITADDWKRTTDLLNRSAARLARSGIRLAYHNHSAEFLPLADGSNGFDLLLANTDPGLVQFELDIGWAVSAGQDLDALFRRAGNRIRLLHLKDTGAKSGVALEMVPADVGTGIVPWHKVADAIRNYRIRHLFVEQEPPFPGEPMDSVRTAYRYLTTLFASASRKGN